MLRVLMVLEDYGELMFLQTVLKKIGFDVDAIQNPRSFEERLLQMNPELLVMTGFGKRVRGFDLAKGLRKKKGLPKVMLLKHMSSNEEDIDGNVDIWLSTPVGAVDFIQAVSDLCGLDKAVLQEKFQKLHLQEQEQDQTRILNVNPEAGESLERVGSSGNFGVLKDSTMSMNERKSRYAKFLNGQKPEKHGFALKQVQDQIKQLRKEEQESDNEELERQRRLFVDHLFKKS